MKKALSVILALIMMFGVLSSFTFTASAEEGKSLTWPLSDYDFKKEAVTPSPFLGELKIGENKVSCLLKGYYTFTAPKSGYYLINNWFRISDKIENNTVTELSYYGTYGNLQGIIKLEENVERCIQFYDNSGVEHETRMKDSYDIEIDFLGSTVSALPQTDTLCTSSFDKIENGRYQVNNLPIVFRFSEGFSTTESSFFAAIDNTDIGKHKARIELPIDSLEDIDVEINITDHPDKDNDGKCDICSSQMTGGRHCKLCGKIHSGSVKEFFIGIFHRILSIILPNPAPLPRLF